MEWVRSLVYSRDWDYCVIWKLGDDPSRFIEWMDCCCCGGGQSVNVKEEEESDGEQRLVPVCRDGYNQHPMRTSSCHKLAQFPAFIPLYSGVHGDVATSNQTKWLTHSDSSNSTHSLESNGTQVIIPVVGGLIELFTTKCAPKDQNLIDYITSHYKASIVHDEPMAALSYTTTSVNEKPRELRKLPASLHCKNFSPNPQNPSFEGSFSASNLSNEHQSFKSGSAHASKDTSPTQSIEKPNFNVKTSPKRKNESVLGYSNVLIDNESNMKIKPKPEREQYQSKNLITERKRRTRIKDGLFALRALVPKITKMDRASILGDAIDYIDELQRSKKKFEDELREMTEEDECKNNADLEVPEKKASFVSTRQMEAKVEVNQIGARDFLLKLVCNQKRGWFMRLMEAVNCLGLQVIDANVTTWNGMVLNVLKVESERKEVEAKDLEDKLTKLTS